MEARARCPAAPRPKSRPRPQPCWPTRPRSAPRLPVPIRSRRIAVSGDARLDGLTQAGIETHPGTAPDEAAAISVARWGIAETGSVVIHSAPDQPILNAMLPRHWLVAVEETRILPFLDDYAALAKPAPRNAVLITGSSGTTDIEGYFVRGAHGPGFVHVLLISH